MTELRWHPAAKAFPLMAGAEFDQFVEDIRVNGLRRPIEIYEGEDWPDVVGMGIDGRNRSAACARLGIEPAVRILTDEDIGPSITSYIISINVARRNLSSSQAAMVGVELKDQFRMENERRRLEGSKRGGQIAKAMCAGVPLLEIFPEGHFAENRGKTDTFSREQAARAVGSNGRYVQDAENINALCPSLGKMVLAGSLTIPQAKAALKLQDDQFEAFNALESGAITHEQFRHWCLLKDEHPDLWKRFRAGSLPLEAAIVQARSREAASRKILKGALSEPDFQAAARARIYDTMCELGASATPEQIAEKADFSVRLVREIIDPEAAPAITRGEEHGIDAETKRPLYLAKPGEPMDRLRRPLDGAMLEIFKDVPAFKAAMEQTEALERAVIDRQLRPSGKHFDFRQAGDCLRRTKTLIASAEPYCVCPSCGGRADKCPTCANAGFISLGGYEKLHVDLQEVAEGYLLLSD